MIGLLLIVLVCTLIGYLVGNPTVGLVVGVLLALLVGWAASAPY